MVDPSFSKKNIRLSKQSAKKDKLKDKTVEELRKMASRKKIEGRSKMNKAELVRALKKKTSSRKMKGGMNGLPNNVLKEIYTYTSCKEFFRVIPTLSKGTLNKINWDLLPPIPIEVSPEVNLNIDCAICNLITNDDDKQKCKIYYNKCRIFDLLNRNVTLLNYFSSIYHQNPINMNKIDEKMLDYLLMSTIANTENSDTTRNEQNFLRLLGVDRHGTAIFAGLGLTSVTIPNFIIRISGASFSNNILTSVTIPDSVTEIMEKAFMNNKLTTVTLSNSLEQIWSYSFQNNNLTSIVIPNSVRSIGGRAFQNNNLTSIVIPNSVTRIGSLAFDQNPLTTASIHRRFKPDLNKIFGERVNEIHFTFTK